MSKVESIKTEMEGGIYLKSLLPAFCPTRRIDPVLPIIKSCPENDVYAITFNFECEVHVSVPNPKIIVAKPHHHIARASYLVPEMCFPYKLLALSVLYTLYTYAMLLSTSYTSRDRAHGPPRRAAHFNDSEHSILTAYRRTHSIAA